MIDKVSMSTSIFLENIHHAYARTDGTYQFPNSREGDMLKTAKVEIEALLRRLENLREAVNEAPRAGRLEKSTNP